VSKTKASKEKLLVELGFRLGSFYSDKDRITEEAVEQQSRLQGMLDTKDVTSLTLEPIHEILMGNYELGKKGAELMKWVRTNNLEDYVPSKLFNDLETWEGVGGLAKSNSVKEYLNNSPFRKDKSREDVMLEV
jgi:hypothetical protein